MVYCVLFVMMSTNTIKKKNSAVSEDGHVLTAYDVFFFFFFFFSGRKLGQYADQELLKYVFQNKTPDFKIYY